MPRGVSILDEARLQKRLWTPPTDYASVGPCWDMSRIDTVSVSGTDITAIRDTNGTRNNTTNTAAAGNISATFTANGFNGFPVATFTPTAVLLLASTVTLSGAWCVVAVVRMTANTSLLQYILGGSGKGVFIGGTAGGIENFGCFDGANLISASGAAPSCLNTWAILTWTASKLYLNGLETGYANAGTVPTIDIVRISGRDDVGGFDVRGDIAQIIIGTTARQRKMEGAAAWTFWGEENPLTAGHLYKSRPPMLGT